MILWITIYFLCLLSFCLGLWLGSTPKHECPIPTFSEWLQTLNDKEFEAVERILS
jgi:hypothetical protein